MANPANLLLAQLESWRVPSNGAPRDVRVKALGGDDEVVRATSLAVLHLKAIEELLAGMEAEGRKVDQYKRAFPRWQNWVLAYPASWVHQIGDDTFNSQADIDLLAALGDVVEQYLPSYKQDELANLRGTLEDIRRSLAEDQSIPPDLRRHLHGLLLNASECLEHYDLFGEFELKKAVDRLLVSVGVAAQVSKDKSRWQRLMQNLLFPVVAGLMIEAPEMVLRLTDVLPPG